MAQSNFISRWTDHGNEVLAVIHHDTIEKLNKAGDIIRDSAKVECPEGRTGNLRKSIRVRRFPREKIVRVIVGSQKAWYPHLVLFGTVERYTKGKGPKRFKKYNTGVSRPNNFLLRAINKNVATLTALFGKPITVVK